MRPGRGSHETDGKQYPLIEKCSVFHGKLNKKKEIGVYFAAGVMLNQDS